MLKMLENITNSSQSANTHNKNLNSNEINKNVEEKNSNSQIKLNEKKDNNIFDQARNNSSVNIIKDLKEEPIPTKKNKYLNIIKRKIRKLNNPKVRNFCKKYFINKTDIVFYITI